MNSDTIKKNGVKDRVLSSTDFLTQHMHYDNSPELIKVNVACINLDNEEFSNSIRKLKPDSLNSSPNHVGSILLWAAQQGLNEDIEYILESQKVNKETIKELIPYFIDGAPPQSVAILCTLTETLNTVDIDGKTPFHHFIDKSYLGTVCELIESGQVENVDSYFEYAISAGYGAHIAAIDKFCSKEQRSEALGLAIRLGCSYSLGYLLHSHSDLLSKLEESLLINFQSCPDEDVAGVIESLRPYSSDLKASVRFLRQRLSKITEYVPNESVRDWNSKRWVFAC